MQFLWTAILCTLFMANKFDLIWFEFGSFRRALRWFLHARCRRKMFSFQRRTSRPIYTLYGSNDVVPSNDGPSGVRTISGIIWGKCAPTPPLKKRAWIGVFKPNSQNTKTCILSKLLQRFSQISHSDKDHQTPFVDGPITHTTNPRCGRPPYWKKDISWYLCNSLTDRREIWQDYANWPSPPYRRLQIRIFKNPRWWTAAILKIIENPRRGTLIDSYLESPFPTACLL